MKKIKTLIPTLREKKRYIKFQVIPEPGEDYNYSDLEAAIWNVALQFLGEIGVSKASIWIIKDLWDPKSQTGVIKCKTSSIDEVIASLGLIDRLGDNRVCFKILKVSGTIKKLGVKTKKFK